MMHKRRLMTLRVVGMAMLLTAIPSWSAFAADQNSSKGDAPAAPATSAADTSTTDQITLLKKKMALQQQQIEQMQKALAEQNQLLEQLSTTPAPTAPAAQSVQSAQAAAAAPAVQHSSPTQPASQTQSTSLGVVASTTPLIPQNQNKTENAITSSDAATRNVWVGATPGGGDDTSPLQIHIGDATLIPVGFMDFTSVWRNHDTNGSIATNFGNIPYASTTAYAPNLGEFRLSTENSRIGFRADAIVHGWHVMGYMEADFHGNNATSVAVSTNSNTLRERLYWVDLNSGHFELLGGQTWSLATPGRSGISPLPADIFYSQDVDVNYQAGLVFGRIPELRFVWHPSKKVAWAFAIDSPDQYVGGNGGAGNIVLPALLNTTATYQGELDYNAANTLSTPNVAPDIITKLAFDPSKRVHVEIMGMERSFKVYDPLTSQINASEGGAVAFNAGFELVKGLRFLTNDYWSDGGGRYIYGQVPDLIAHANGQLSLIHASSTVTGFEFTHRKTMLYTYYGGIYAQKNTALDANGTTLIGYGMESGSNATNAQNRNVQEATFGFNQTIWKNGKYGAVNFMGQYSYLLRDPWFEKAGVQPNANVNMLFFNLRYTLPGSAPTMGK